MAASDVEIANLALRHLAQKPIGALDEASTEARVITTYFDQVRDEVLRDVPWPFATVRDALTLVATTPNDEWSYSYRYPSECLAFRRILSGSRVDSRGTRVPYKIGRDLDGILIFTDKPDAQGEWTTRVDIVEQYQPDFVQCLALKLAGYIAPSITGGDQFKLGARALELYQAAKMRAHANALNEEQPDEEPDSEMIEGR